MQVNLHAEPCARLLSEASVNSSILDCLEPGTRLRVMGSISGWSHVRLLDGTEGWLDASFLEPAPELPAAPVVTAPQPADAAQREVSRLRQRIQQLESQAGGGTDTARLETELAAARLRATELERKLAAAEERLAAAERLGAEQTERLQALTAELADARVRIAEAELKTRLASRSEPAAMAPAETPIRVRQPIVSAPEPPPAPAEPRVAVRVPAPMREEAAPPPPEPVVEAVAGIDAAINAVRAWATAWSDQRVEDYLSFYAQEFQPPGGLSRQAWAAQRRQRLGRPSYIRVTISSLSAQAAEDGTVTVTFRQEYESDTFADVVTKVLTLVERQGGWRVVSERAAS